jgi:hypothetical protein
MRPAKYSIAALALNALWVMTISTALAAGAGKNVISRGGGKAAEHMSAKGSGNTNAQWSADPERGWVRAEERHDLAEKDAPRGSGHGNGKQKNKGKPSKF